MSRAAEVYATKRHLDLLGYLDGMGFGAYPMLMEIMIWMEKRITMLG
jgi:hypothetical protein